MFKYFDILYRTLSLNFDKVLINFSQKCINYTSKVCLYSFKLYFIKYNIATLETRLKICYDQCTTLVVKLIVNFPPNNIIKLYKVYLYIFFTKL